MALHSNRDMTPAVDVRALTKLFGATGALFDVTFAVSAGQLVTVTGAHGSGKSTLLKLLAGHITPSGGRIRILDLDLRMSRLELTLRIGYVPQVLPSCGDMRPHDLLDFGGRARQLAPASIEQRIREVAAFCNLTDHLHRACGTLEPATSIRVALAQALLHGPSLLLLDEPFRALGGPDVGPVARLIERLAGRATVIVTGPASTAALLNAGRNLELQAGRLVGADLSSPVPAGTAP